MFSNFQPPGRRVIYPFQKSHPTHFVFTGGNSVVECAIGRPERGGRLLQFGKSVVRIHPSPDSRHFCHARTFTYLGTDLGHFLKRRRTGVCIDPFCQRLMYIRQSLAFHSWAAVGWSGRPGNSQITELKYK
jgi:hypothetical protein